MERTPAMLPRAEPIREIDGRAPGVLSDALLTSTEPVVLRGLIDHWPFVAAARESFDAADTYLRRHYRDATVTALLGGPDIEGRFFYNADLSGFNYAPLRVRFDAILDELRTHRDNPRPPAIYVGSTTVDTCLPGFRTENDVGLDTGDTPRDALASIWVGNRTRIAAHYDLPDNLACVSAGRRRFTLFPPEQLANLYIGPLDFTPAGQAISLVDFHRPDLARFPRFVDAMRHARVAELDPGDALFIPAMWWHHVEALEAFNVLVNYWWRQSPPYMDTPNNALLHAMMSIRELPPEQRRAWQELFRHYVFEPDEATSGHIPAPARGMLAPLGEAGTRQLRAQLLKRLNR